MNTIKIEIIKIVNLPKVKTYRRVGGGETLWTGTNLEKPALAHFWKQAVECSRRLTAFLWVTSEWQCSSAQPGVLRGQLHGQLSRKGVGGFRSPSGPASDRTLCSYRTGCEVCVANKSCILPCRFQAGQEVVIHWIYLDSTGGRTLSASGAKVKVQGSKRNW